MSTDSKGEKQFYKKWQFWAIIVAVIAVIGVGCCVAFSNNTTTTGEVPSAETTDWNKWLKQYESWVDKYVAAYKKYMADPSNTNAQSEYLKLADQASKWVEEGKKFSTDDILSTDEATEFAETYNRILEKVKSMNE